MRFVIAATFFAGAAVATLQMPSVVYETDIVTVTSCGPEVSDCTVTKTPIVDVSTSTDVVVYPTTPVEPTFSSVYSNGTTSLTEVGETTCVGSIVKTKTTSVTTVIPTVIYETIEVPCETTVSYKPSTGFPTGSLPPPAQTTPVFTDSAASIGVSGLAAVAAGLIALLA